MFMDICNPSENSCFSKIFPVLLKCDFSWFQPIIGRFIRCVFWEFNIYNLFKSFFINTVLSFSTRCEYYLWLDSKYNVRRCDVLVRRIKTTIPKSFRTWSNIFLKMATPFLLVKPSMWYEARSLYYRFYRFNLVWPRVLLMIYVKY